MREHPDDYPARLGWTPRVHPLAADLVAGVRPALLMLLGGVVFVMLIAISNISNLLLVRAVEREREIAIQRALGATRLRILLNRLVEGPRWPSSVERLDFSPASGAWIAAAARAGSAAARVRDPRGRPRVCVRGADISRHRPARRARGGAPVVAHRSGGAAEIRRTGGAGGRSRPRAQRARRGTGGDCRRPAGQRGAARSRVVEPATRRDRHLDQPAADVASVAASAQRAVGRAVLHPREARRAVPENHRRVAELSGRRPRRPGHGTPGGERQRDGLDRRRRLDTGSPRSRDGDADLGDPWLLPGVEHPARIGASAGGHGRSSRPACRGDQRNAGADVLRSRIRSAGVSASSTAAGRWRRTRRGSPSSGSPAT